jgi:hypothetical protein
MFQSFFFVIKTHSDFEKIIRILFYIKYTYITEEEQHIQHEYFVKMQI